jgi:hypothetical protein
MRNQHGAGFDVRIHRPFQRSHEFHKAPQAVGEGQTTFVFAHEQRVLPCKIHVQFQMDGPLLEPHALKWAVQHIELVT